VRMTRRSRAGSYAPLLLLSACASASRPTVSAPSEDRRASVDESSVAVGEDPRQKGSLSWEDASVAQCKGTEGEKLGRACGVTRSSFTCAIAKREDDHCCRVSCTEELEHIRWSIVENSAQACAIRVHFGAGRIKPVCELDVPSLSPIGGATMAQWCNERCAELNLGTLK
jgi:hypothetical protein